MKEKTNVGGYDRIVRGVLAVVLSVVSIGAVRRGKHKTALVAGLGALGFGFTVTTQYCGGNDLLDRDTTADGVARTDTATLTTTPSGRDEHSQSASTFETAGDRSDPDTTLTCASCGNPIRPGEPRGPNDQNEIVHVGCP